MYWRQDPTVRALLLASAAERQQMLQPEVREGTKIELKCGGFVVSGILNYLFGGNQTVQMYGRFEGFPISSALFGLGL